jgi:cell division septation protein DedD
LPTGSAAAAPATPAAPNGEQKFPGANDQRVKDWVSRFGGGAPIRIGIGHGMPRYEESATLDVPARTAGAAAEPAPPATPHRILIVDQEPQMPPELIARLNKVTGKKRRRRGPSATIQGAALAVAVVMLVVVLARQAGFGKHLGFDAADTSAHVVATPAPPPLTLVSPGEPGSKGKSASGSSSAKSKRSELVADARKSSKPTSRKVILTPSHTESPPPVPNRVASSTPVQTIVPPSEPPPSEDAVAGPGHKFGIIAGSFPNNDMAKAEKDHLARLVPYRVWIDKTKVQGQRTYQLMVGRFDTMEHAWDSAQVLMRRGLIRDANVRILTEREAR